MKYGRPCPNCGSTDSSLKFVEPPFQVLKCRHCSLVYLGNPPHDGLVYEQYYESRESDVREYHGHSNDAVLAELFAINSQRIARLKKIKPSGRLLDIGCGRGYFLKTARDNGYEVHGIDISEKAIAYAQQGFNLSVKVGTIDQSVGMEKPFDVVTLWHVLEHFVDPYKSLQLSRALLADDGICVAEVPNLLSLKFLMARHKWEGGNHPLYHRTFFTAHTLREAFLKAGFSDVLRIKLSYRIPGRSRTYERAKVALNLVGMDAFLAVVARR